MITLTLHGVVPSKKNAWRRGAQGRVYLPGQVQADIDALVVRACAARHRLDLEPLRGKKLAVTATFYTSKQNKDLDNMFTTILDVLQKAEIIENDKLVREFHVFEKINSKEDHTDIALRELSMPIP
jgi:Holliday junction resolvase RusA-like endonuclease